MNGFSMFHAGSNRLRRVNTMVITALRGEPHIVSWFHFSRVS